MTDFTASPYAERLRRATSLSQWVNDDRDLSTDDDAQAHEWLASINPRSHVGSIHHTVPRLLLDRWSTKDQVRIYSRPEAGFSTRNIQALGVRDFYSFVDQEGQLDSTFESLLGVVEDATAPIIRRLLSPFTPQYSLSPEEVAQLAQLVAFQVVRTTRRRREVEVFGDWYAKSLVAHKVADSELRKLTATPHQNDMLHQLMKSAGNLWPFIAFRPLTLVTVEGHSLLMGDEPVLVNVGPDDGRHHPDCYMTQRERDARLTRERKKKKRRRQNVSRVVHLRATKTRGLGVALEIVLPISPHVALRWGALQDEPCYGEVEVDHLTGEVAERFASTINGVTADQALDWVATTLDDETFTTRDFPPLGPVMQVCDDDTAAALAVNAVPERWRPRRLDRRP